MADEIRDFIKGERVQSEGEVRELTWPLRPRGNARLPAGQPRSGHSEERPQMQIILVTGTSTGIGFATAVSLARAGHDVFATMRNPDRSPELQALAREDHLPITVMPLDVDDDQ